MQGMFLAEYIKYYETKKEEMKGSGIRKSGNVMFFNNLNKVKINYR